jgi:hypothetical protein
MSTAKITGEDLYVLYDQDPANAPRGCSTSNCRLLVAVELW